MGSPVACTSRPTSRINCAAGPAGSAASSIAEERSNSASPSTSRYWPWPVSATPHTSSGIGRSPRSAAHDETLRAFRRAGRELALPDTTKGYTIEHAYAFLGDLQSRGASAAYRNRRHREVRAFFSWCQKMGRLDHDRRHVFARVKLAPEEKRVKPPFSADEVGPLLAGQDRSRLKGCLEYALVLFLLDTGVRVTECFDVRLEEVDWEQGHVLVHG